MLFSICGHIMFEMTFQQNLLQVPSQQEESNLLLSLPPDRIGHGTFLHPEMGGSQSLVDQVVTNNIPLGKSEMALYICVCGKLKWYFSL